jgi:DNA-binding HxlR family transcriptional regulator
VSEPPSPRATAAILVAVRQAADLLCDRWTLMLLALLAGGATRFAALVDGGVPARLAALRLRTLEGAGLVVKLPYCLRPLRHEYRLTPAGEAFLPVLHEMLRWEVAHGAVPPPARLLGGRTLRAVMACAACGADADARGVALQVTGRGVAALPAKQRATRRSSLDSADGQALPWLAASLDIFGDKWGIEILVCAFMRVRRFGALRDATGIAANILSNRLERLQALGLLTPGGEGYWLTPRGLDLYGVLVAIQHWADHWLVARTRAPIRLVHRSCGAAFLPSAFLPDAAVANASALAVSVNHAMR